MKLSFIPLILALAGAIGLLLPAMSCSPNHLTPTPAPMPTSTPTLMPTLFPPSSLEKVELDPDYPPSSAFGDEYVAVGSDGEVHLINIVTSERRQLTYDGHQKRQPVISAEYVAWFDQRRQIEVHDSAARPPQSLSDDIFVLNLATGEQKRITEAPAKRYALRISGHRLVWQDNRNEIGEYYTHFDIYAYDLKAGREIPVAVKTGSQRGPSLYGDTAVWMDNRKSPLASDPDSGHSGCGDCPDNRFDIYVFDFTTGEERPLIETGYFNTSPVIHGDYLGWQAYHPGKDPVVKLRNLDTGREIEITNDPRVTYGPSISGDYVVWSVGFPCDVNPGKDRPPGTGAYARNLATGEVRQLSDYVEPRVWASGNIAFVVEACGWFGLVPWTIYAVLLE